MTRVFIVVLGGHAQRRAMNVSVRNYFLGGISVLIDWMAIKLKARGSWERDGGWHATNGEPVGHHYFPRPLLLWWRETPSCSVIYTSKTRGWHDVFGRMGVVLILSISECESAQQFGETCTIWQFFIWCSHFKLEIQMEIQMEKNDVWFFAQQKNLSGTYGPNNTTLKHFRGITVVDRDKRSKTHYLLWFVVTL